MKNAFLKNYGATLLLLLGLVVGGVLGAVLGEDARALRVPGTLFLRQIDRRQAQDDVVIVEVEEKDPVWAVWPDESGILRGGNAMGKILTICRRHLINGTAPNIDTALLNASGIHILGSRVQF